MDGTTKAIAKFYDPTECLEREFAHGMFVRVIGLVSKPELNGRLGMPEKYDETSCRWTVHIGDGERLNVKRPNLEAGPPMDNNMEVVIVNVDATDEGLGYLLGKQGQPNNHLANSIMT